MNIFTREVTVARDGLCLENLRRLFGRDKRAVRFVVTHTRAKTCTCELDSLEDAPEKWLPRRGIFEFTPRRSENTGAFNVVLLVPTGIGAEIGGHCGDANSLARLFASACDTLITHPNVVNAADMNEQTENTLYVEGSFITRLLMGEIGLQKARSNRVLLLMDRHEDPCFNDAIVNMVSTARICLGMEADVLQMDDLMSCTACYTRAGKASGRIENLERVFSLVDFYRGDYDAFALNTHVDVPGEMETAYYKTPGGVNPWGGIEAMLTHGLSLAFGAPCAHSPMSISLEFSDHLFKTIGIVEPRKASETFSRTYLYCILKGLHRAPRAVPPEHGGITASDVACMVIPDGCIGLPTLAALEQGIPVIAVRENRNCMKNRLQDLPFRPGKLFVVENYLEAIGVLAALRAGVSPSAVRRPYPGTRVLSAPPCLAERVRGKTTQD